MPLSSPPNCYLSLFYYRLLRLQGFDLASRAPQRFHQQPSARSRLLLNINPSPSSLHYDSALITCFVSIDFPQASAHLDVKLF